MEINEAGEFCQDILQDKELFEGKRDGLKAVKKSSLNQGLEALADATEFLIITYNVKDPDGRGEYAYFCSHPLLVRPLADAVYESATRRREDIDDDD